MEQLKGANEKVTPYDSRVQNRLRTHFLVNNSLYPVRRNHRLLKFYFCQSRKRKQGDCGNIQEWMSRKNKIQLVETEPPLPLDPGSYVIGSV